jgi:hypothetical protein
MKKGMIFFSYSRTDSTIALRLAKDIRDRGFDPWIDQVDIEPGSHWDASIEAALDQADLLIVLLSASAIASNNVRDEVSYALREGKKIIPVLFDGCKMPFRLDRLQFVRYTADHTAVLDQLVGTLHQLVNGGVTRDGLVVLVERDEKKIALGGLMATLLDHASRPERDFLDWHEQARSSYAKKEYAKAKIAILNALLLYPENEKATQLEKSINKELYVDSKSGPLAQGCLTMLVLIICGIIAGGIFWLFGFGKWSAGFTAVIVLYVLVKAYPIIREVKTKPGRGHADVIKADLLFNKLVDLVRNNDRQGAGDWFKTNFDTSLCTYSDGSVDRILVEQFAKTVQYSIEMGLTGGFTSIQNKEIVASLEHGASSGGSHCNAVLGRIYALGLFDVPADAVKAGRYYKRAVGGGSRSDRG